MASPRIEINLERIGHNVRMLDALYGAKGIKVIGVTKGVCGDPAIVETLLKNGIETLADSRVSNLKNMREAGIKAQFMLLRAPLISEVETVVKYADISLNSELLTIKILSKYAIAQKKSHKVILMIELGDLREGIMPIDVTEIVTQIVKLEGIELVGIGTNLACFGGIKPDEGNMSQLSAIAGELEEAFGLSLQFISGGGSTNYNWFSKTKNVKRVNNLRIGESIYLGCEPLHRTIIPKLFTDAFKLIGEVIEIKTKPSLPYGEVGQNAFGEIPVFEDQGLMRRAILGIGLQDVTVSGLIPYLDIDILGASSDHLILNVKQTILKIGDEVSFHLNYGALLSAMTSPYVTKQYDESIECK